MSSGAVFTSHVKFWPGKLDEDTMGPIAAVSVEIRYNSQCLDIDLVIEIGCVEFRVKTSAFLLVVSFFVWVVEQLHASVKKGTDLIWSSFLFHFSESSSANSSLNYEAWRVKHLHGPPNLEIGYSAWISKLLSYTDSMW